MFAGIAVLFEGSFSRRHRATKLARFTSKAKSPATGSNDFLPIPVVPC